MSHGPRLDFDPGTAQPDAPPGDTRDPPTPFGLAALAILLAAVLAFVLWRYRRHLHDGARAVARVAVPHWREIGIAALLGAILVKLW